MNDPNKDKPEFLQEIYTPPVHKEEKVNKKKKKKEKDED
mgnify:CR=1 FL=1